MHKLYTDTAYQIVKMSVVMTEQEGIPIVDYYIEFKVIEKIHDAQEEQSSE